MSASSHSLIMPPHAPDVLGELLHSLSQPLTTLRCSLELELEHSSTEAADRQQTVVSLALQQTEKVIGMIQLMREYLEAEQPGPETYSTPLAPAIRNVIEELSSIAAIRGIQLRLAGTCAATVSVPEPRLRLALQYLLAPMIDAGEAAVKVTLLLGEGPAGAVLRVAGTHGSRLSRDPSHPIFMSAIGRVRLSIATRVLEAGGATLVHGEGAYPGFVLRIPRRLAS